MLPPDYEERVYAGVLGKIIGVYVGRPFEGWTYQRILRELGEITSYVNERVPARPPLIVTDDDISGTFTFLRALSDYGVYGRDHPAPTPAQIGQTWLNYLIERQTILWWGGMGNSTEHTAYVRLKNGIPAPRSGSMELNGQVVAEQIGAQIFIDGWAMVAPGDPEFAADLARRAASVSHDGQAIHAAQVVAAMEAQAFVEPDMDKLFETGLSVIPRDCLIAQIIADVRHWCVQDEDWHKTRARIEHQYGYDKYGGNCHVVPNHALIIMALAYAPDDFQRTLMIVNTSGWDTDCNSANVGCLMGIKNGLAGIDASPFDFRTPIADRIYLPTADGGRCITDAVQETYRVTRMGRALQGLPQIEPKGGARFHFELPGSMQGFHAQGATIENVPGHSAAGRRSLAIHSSPGLSNLTRSNPRQVEDSKPSACVSTPTFVPPEGVNMPGYALLASPTLYPGQAITAGISSDMDATVNLFVRVYGADDKLEQVAGQAIRIRAGEDAVLRWLPPVEGSTPIGQVGVQVSGEQPGTLYLDHLTWSGAPTVTFAPPAHNGTLWQRAWVKACDEASFRQGIRVCQDGSGGLLIQGEREWANYAVQARLVPHLARSAGIAACVQGMKRYYALALCDDGQARLIKELDGRHVLAETRFDWSLDGEYDFSLSTQGARVSGSINGQALFDVQDTDRPLGSGAIALFVEAGRMDCNTVSITPQP